VDEVIRYRRHWLRCTSDGSYFRNCPLIVREIAWAQRRGRFILAARLAREWRHIWTEGARAHETFEIGPGDTWSEYDDSPAAIGVWAKKFVRTGRP
jgi:hypothetical protein